MDECFKCGISADRMFLMDAIGDEGIVKICRKCSYEEDLPIIQRPNAMKFKEPEKRRTVYERLSRVAGISNEPVVNKELKKQEKSLREVVDENFKSKSLRKDSPKELIENFHWVLMRVRRFKKITQEQFAREINESVNAIKMAEKGILPEDYLGLVRKFEEYFNVRLIKEEFRPNEEKVIEVIDSENLGKPEEVFEEKTSKILTISDLKEMKRKKEEKIFSEDENYLLNENENCEEPEFVSIGKKVDEVVDKKEDSDDLSQEEIDRILFGEKSKSL